MSEKNDLLNDPNVLRELIMDHYQYPRHHQLTNADGYKMIHMASASCIDDITVECKIENDVIKAINFAGIGCTISTASTSMMTELLIGKTTGEAKELIQNYFNMVNAREYDAESLGEAVALKNVYRQANRINCATIGWRAVEQMIEESEKEQ